MPCRDLTCSKSLRRSFWPPAAVHHVLIPAMQSTAVTSFTSNAQQWQGQRELIAGSRKRERSPLDRHQSLQAEHDRRRALPTAERDPYSQRNGHDRSPHGSHQRSSLHNNKPPLPSRSAPKLSFDADRGAGDDVEGVRILGSGRDNSSGVAFQRREARNAGASSFDTVAPLPEPVRAGSARATGAPAPARKRVEFATPGGGTSSASTATRITAAAGASPAGAAVQRSSPLAGSSGASAGRGAALASTAWAREDERAARKQAAREPSPNLAEIDAANKGEFDNKLAQEIASEGLQLDRDWYLREEEGGMDDERGAAGTAMGDEETYARGKDAQQANRPVRCYSGQ